MNGDRYSVKKKQEVKYINVSYKKEINYARKEQNETFFSVETKTVIVCCTLIAA